MESTQIAALVRRANAGDTSAWRLLVEEYSDLLWGVARRFGMSEAQRADAVQDTWVKLFENLDSIRQPERLPGWLATTARRCCLAVVGETSRERPVDFFASYLDGTPQRFEESDHTSPERSAVRREHQMIVRRVLEELPPQHRRLIDLLMSSPTPCYQTVVNELGMPHGSVGPTRARILAKMRVQLEASGLHDMALT